MPKKTCFIITPIGKPTDPIRRHIDGVVQGIKDAIGGAFDVIVAHEMFDIGSINRQVLEQIYTSDLVIANLTNLNPNVMYELAFRHSVGKPAIVIAEDDGIELPFDIKDERAFRYINDYAGIKALGATLRACIGNINFKDETPCGPIHDALVGMVKVGVRNEKMLHTMLSFAADTYRIAQETHCCMLSDYDRINEIRDVTMEHLKYDHLLNPKKSNKKKGPPS